MQAANDAGVNFFDNAEAYADGEAEVVMGKVIKRAGWKRSDLVVSTKIFWGGDGPNDTGLSRKHIIEGTNAALARLQMDYVDLIFCHRPDIHTPIEETVRAMSHIVNSGKAFYWGTSEWSAAQIMRGLRHRPPRASGAADHGAAAVQHVPPRARREGIRPAVRGDRPGHDHLEPAGQRLPDRQVQRRHPRRLARSACQGYEWLRKTAREQGRPGMDRQDAPASAIADELGCTMSQLALAWCLKNPHVSTVITGASRPEQVVENMQALDVVAKITDDVMQRIEAHLANKPEPPADFR